jgi:hypothetical protein
MGSPPSVALNLHLSRKNGTFDSVEKVDKFGSVKVFKGL